MMAFSALREPLRISNVVAGKALFVLSQWSADGCSVATQDGLRFEVDGDINAMLSADIDRLFVVASYHTQRYDTPLIRAALRTLSRRGVGLGAACTGAYFLASAGLLDEHCATVHWQYSDAFRRRFPKVTLRESLFEIAPLRYTAAGGTAGIDLQLALLGAEHGQQLMTEVADQLVSSRLRDAQDAQRLPPLRRLRWPHRAIRQSLELMETNLEEPLRITDLARYVELSPRELERLFQRHLHSSPGAYYRQMRLHRARALLLQSDAPLSEIAEISGFGSVSAFSRAYKRQYGAAPQLSRKEQL